MALIKNWLRNLKKRKTKKAKATTQADTSVVNDKPIELKIAEVKQAPECKDNTDLTLERLLEKYRE